MDAQDRSGRWHKAVVVEEEPRKPHGLVRICLESQGGRGAEAWLPRDSDRIARATSETGGGIMPMVTPDRLTLALCCRQ